MKEELIKKEIEELIKIYNLNCSIREFKDKVDWYSISICKKLTENFIRKFKDLVDWDSLSYKQEFSENFIYEFKDKLNIEILIKKNLITKKRLKEFEKEELNWKRKISKRSYRFEIMDI